MEWSFVDKMLQGTSYPFAECYALLRTIEHMHAEKILLQPTFLLYNGDKKNEQLMDIENHDSYS